MLQKLNENKNMIKLHFYNLILLLVIVIQLSCTNSNIGQNIISFNIGYPTSRINAGEICFKNDTNLYLYYMILPKNRT